MTPLLSLRRLAAWLRVVHTDLAGLDAGGEYVGLVDLGPGIGWFIAYAPYPDMVGREYVPGDGRPFDAVATARRLLAAARDAQAVNSRVRGLA